MIDWQHPGPAAPLARGCQSWTGLPADWDLVGGRRAKPSQGLGAFRTNGVMFLSIVPESLEFSGNTPRSIGNPVSHAMQNNSIPNLDRQTVDSFGDEWTRFDQSEMSDAEAAVIFGEYFSVFPWDALPDQARGFDMGCGSGRWARLVAPRVGHLHCVEPSRALDVARQALQAHDNVSFHQASLDDVPIDPGSQDFGYSLGVLHHVPDTSSAIQSCVALLKPGAPLLLYLYYAFDNRPLPFRIAWRASDWLRRGICRLPHGVKHLATDVLALLVYLPLARGSRVLELMGFSVSNIPLSYYRARSWYTIRTDSSDRFGTPLEKRFRRHEITAMMESAGLGSIVFSERAPYWCAVGHKSAACGPAAPARAPSSE